MTETNIEVRKATIGDYHAFVRLTELMSRHHYERFPTLCKPALIPFHTEQMFLNLLQNPERAIYFAIDKSRRDENGNFPACGFAATRTLEARPSHPAFVLPKTVHIDEIITDVGYRRSGVASKLMSAIEVQARDVKAEKITLNVFYDNQDAIGFYDGAGFSIAKVEMERTIALRSTT